MDKILRVSFFIQQFNLILYIYLYSLKIVDSLQPIGHQDDTGTFYAMYQLRNETLEAIPTEPILTDYDCTFGHG